MIPGITCAKFRRSVETPALRLRLCGWRDIGILQTLFYPDFILKLFPSSLSFRRWLARTFQVLYLLEPRKAGGIMGKVGFIGLYRIDPGRSIWLSTGIFNPEDRSKGYGRQGLEILLDYLRESGLSKKVYAEVMKTNERSLSFFEKSGFRSRMDDENTFVLEKEL
jgi:RimJ/RimL family protein N-acetyltransferase